LCPWSAWEAQDIGDQDFVDEYNIHQNAGGAFGIATSISEGTSEGKADVDQLAVVNNNANDVAVTTFVLP